jgi:glutaconate CoA-transferase subunit A
LSIKEVVSKFVRNGNALAFAGSGGRLSIGFAYEVIKQRKKNLSFVSAGTGAPCLDLLVGAKCVSRAEISFTMVTCLNIRRALESNTDSSSVVKDSRKRGKSPSNDGYKLEIEDYSNLAMSLRFFAGATKIPFIPVRSLRGSDIERVRTFLGKEKMATVTSPFKDKSEVEVLPPCTPDVSIMHSQFADEDGNILAYGPAGSDNWALRSAQYRVITTEKIVPKRFVKENKMHVFLPGFMVDAVCEIPYGAHPYGLVDCYDLDEIFQKEYYNMCKTQEGFDEWAKEWIFNIDRREEYLRKIGDERLAKITTNKKFLRNIRFD